MRLAAGQRDGKQDAGGLTLLLVVAVLALLGHSAVGLAAAYSYWTDELFSVALSAMEPGRRLGYYLNDVHPPLYQMALAVWIDAFGTSEMATRSLSLVLVAASLGAILVLRSVLGRRHMLVFAILYLSNWLVPFYAQETRSYGMLLALSTLSFVLFLAGQTRWLFLSLMAMGLTHFFGTLQALIYLAWLAVAGRRSAANWAAVVASGAVVAAWPAYYLLFGNARAVAGGKFWIESTAFDGLEQGAVVAFPPLAAVVRAAYLGLGQTAVFALVLAVLLGGAALLFWLGWRRLDDRLRLAVVKAGYLVAATVLLASMANVHTPITTIRNFIVIVAPAAFLVSAMVLGLFSVMPLRRLAVPSLVLLFGAAQVQTYGKLAEKMQPQQDWKRVAALVEAERAARPAPVYFFKAAPLPDATWPDDVPEFYMAPGTTVTGIRVGDVARMPPGAIIIFGHIRVTANCRNEMFDELARLGRGYRTEFVPQGSVCQNGYVKLLG